MLRCYSATVDFWEYLRQSELFILAQSDCERLLKKWCGGSLIGCFIKGYKFDLLFT